MSNNQRIKQLVGVGWATGTAATVFLTGWTYWVLYRPRMLHQQALQERMMVPRPWRKTPFYVAGDEPVSALWELSGETQFKFTLRFIHRFITITLYATPLFIASVLYWVFGMGSIESLSDQVLALFTRLGPSFVKLGQWMSTRPDLFPIVFCDKLEGLCDTAPQHSWEETERVLQRANILSKLYYIDHTPINSGSIAQVHRARLREPYYATAVDVADSGRIAALGLTSKVHRYGGVHTISESVSEREEEPIPMIAPSGTDRKSVV